LISTAIQYNTSIWRICQYAWNNLWKWNSGHWPFRKKLYGMLCVYT